MSSETLNVLLEREKELETMIKQHAMVLQANKIGLHEPLTDGEGYPLKDIDHYAVRKARHSINCLQNDRKALLAEIETKMVLYFGQERSTVPTGAQDHQPMEVDDGGEKEAVKTSLEPFAFVEKVEPGQLADRMGIAVNDKILQIGTLSSQNFKTLNQIQAMIQNSRGGKLLFVVRKANSSRDVTIEMDLSSEGTRLGFCLKPLKG